MSLNNRLSLLTAGLFFLVLSFNAGTALAEIRVPQHDGSELVLETPAQRVITLAPNLAEIMFEAGAGGSLLATVEYSNFPEAAAALPRIGDAFRFDLELILSFKPDLVIAWHSGNPSVALDRLEELGLNVWRTELRKPADIPELLRQLAHATGFDESGAKAAHAAEAKLAALASRHQGKPSVSYFYQVAERPLFTLNGVHIISQGLKLCGGINVFAAEPVLAPQISREAVILANPEVMFAARLPESEDPLTHWKEWPRIRAVASGSLYHLPADKISRATPRMLDSLELACTLLHQGRDSE
jgi:iron complex transport system substrate-binding protein